MLVVDSYATIRRSMRRTAAVVTRVRRDLAKREVDQHISIYKLRLLLLEKKQQLILVSFAEYILTISFFCFYIGHIYIYILFSFFLLLGSSFLLTIIDRFEMNLFFFDDMI